MLYKLMLVLFIFGAVIGAINEAGLYSTVMPESGATIDEAEVTEITGSLSDSTVNPFTIIQILMSCGKVLIGGMLSIVTIIPIMVSFGVPLVWASMVQAPIWLIEVWGVYEFYTGHQTAGQD